MDEKKIVELSPAGELLREIPVDGFPHAAIKLPDGHFQAKAVLRNMITFSRLNLIDVNWPIRKTFDAIFCRNVMIYFDRDTQHKVLKKFSPLLKPDGLLFVGHSENFYFASDVFRLKGKTVYEHAPKA